MNKTIVVAVIAALVLAGCAAPEDSREANGNVVKADADVPTGADGLTTEQRNVKMRVEEDNKPGEIKHLYVISAYSGQVLIYSTVDGKVTSSGKRLDSPEKFHCTGTTSESKRCGVMPRMQDDGTYGSSVPYVYWFDVNGVYHQHYVAGGQILHVSSEPLVVKDVIINMELTA